MSLFWTPIKILLTNCNKTKDKILRYDYSSASKNVQVLGALRVISVLSALRLTGLDIMESAEPL